jgi:hypothetical protein
MKAAPSELLHDLALVVGGAALIALAFLIG